MVNNGTVGGPDNEAEAARDFDRFLSIFFTDVFPQFSHQPFHIAGESFGGTYVPGFVHFIDRRQQMGASDVFRTKIDSVILVDAVIDIIGSGALGQYDHMCRFGADGDNEIPLGYNRTTCRAIETAVPECDRLNRYCLDTYDGHICRAAYEFCADHIEQFIYEGPLSRNPEDDRVSCGGDDDPLCGLGGGIDAYLNSPRVQDALDLPTRPWNFSVVNWDTNTRWEQSNEMYLPTTRELRYILDETDTRVLMLNGNNDIIV